jgi:CRISPR-associated exonuclease Cas4
VEVAHEWQVKYYIYVLERNGIEGATGILEYPVLRHKTAVNFNDADRDKIKSVEAEIEAITSSEDCPQKTICKLCKSCSYYEFCYINENEL